MSSKKLILIILLIFLTLQCSSSFWRGGEKKRVEIQVKYLNFEKNFEKKKQFIVNLRKQQQKLGLGITKGEKVDGLSLEEMVLKRASIKVLADLTEYNLKKEQGLYEELKKLCKINP